MKETIALALLLAGTTRCGGTDRETSSDERASFDETDVGTVAEQVTLPPFGKGAPDFFRCANEHQTCAAGIAYGAFGANQQFLYDWVFGARSCDDDGFPYDPVPNVEKACFFANLDFIGSEHGALRVVGGPREVAYGAGKAFRYKALNGPFTCDNDTFGGDPAENVHKDCYVTLPWYTPDVAENQTMTGLHDTPIAYGANGRHVFEIASGSHPCTNTAFGRDPAVDTPKRCYRFPVRGLANEGQTATTDVPRLVFYGSGLNGNFLSTGPTTQVACNNATFGGDPDVGRPKSCWIDDPTN